MQTITVNTLDDFLKVGEVNRYNALVVPANVMLEVGGRIDLPFSLKTGGNTVIRGTTPDAELNLNVDSTIIGTASSRMMSLSNIRLGGDSSKGLFYLNTNYVHSLALHNVTVDANSFGDVDVDNLTLSECSFINPHMDALKIHTALTLNLRGIRYDGNECLIDATNAVVHGQISVADVYMSNRHAGLFLLNDLAKNPRLGTRPDINRCRNKRYIIQDRSVILRHIQGLPNPRDIFKWRDERGLIRSVDRDVANRLILD